MNSDGCFEDDVLEASAGMLGRMKIGLVEREGVRSRCRCVGNEIDLSIFYLYFARFACVCAFFVVSLREFLYYA